METEEPRPQRLVSLSLWVLGKDGAYDLVLKDPKV